MRTISKVRIFWITILSVWLIISCDEDSQNPVPSVPTNFAINIQTDPEFISLQAQGNSIVVTSGMLGLSTFLGYDDNGLIIYYAGDYEFYIFDRTCPHDFPESVVVESDGTEGFATCPVCGSVFVFPSEGYPTLDSPSTYPLKQYHCYYNPNTGELVVYD